MVYMHDSNAMVSSEDFSVIHICTANGGMMASLDGGHTWAHISSSSSGSSSSSSGGSYCDTMSCSSEGRYVIAWSEQPSPQQALSSRDFGATYNPTGPQLVSKNMCSPLY